MLVLPTKCADHMIDVVFQKFNDRSQRVIIGYNIEIESSSYELRVTVGQVELKR